ncbi:anthranilate synthase component I family protein [Streptomyces sp. ICN988]|uniref:anthranilate synthase component I family protein n=1 Tax=Streptomyces sp. ICN988 TaxID=2983765 RepID=UPI0021E4F338|nr:anthranilate synthase component I family protein [Streptomyces sp. ICN988]MCV2458633.1 anthranilate synthase component I family protein [Streptomyces sp. ICN988]
MTTHSPVHPPAVTVTVRRTRCAAPRPLAAYRALAARFGRDQVYLLESAGGPAYDSRRSLVGFRALLTVTVTRGRVEATGVPALADLATRAMRRGLGLPATDGGPLHLPAPGALWTALRALHAAFITDERGAPDGDFGFLAFLGYDTAHYIEDLPRRIPQEEELPDLSLALFQGCLSYAAESHPAEQPHAELVLADAPGWPSPDAEAVRHALTLGAPAPADEPACPDVPPPARVRDSTTPERFRADARQALAHLRAGDVYQVQLGHELTIESDADPVDVYTRLRLRNPSPYMYLAPFAGRTVIGASPELFVREEGDLLTMRPIAGTLPCGTDPGEAARQAAALRADPKEIAEHVMLVDLCRNDIGRVCRRDTLDAPDMLRTERYTRVLHLVSTVTGRIEPDTDVFDVIAALFPAGTMTGAPKIRAMEIIEALETRRRGLYAGAVGIIGHRGHLNLALCIRTLVHDGGAYRTRASAGIVADSDPDREWTETLAKCSAAHWAVTGEELLT